MIPPTTFLLDRIIARCSLRHVQVLLLAAETGTLRGAAEAAGISPACLEHMISGLEAMLGVELFRRDGDRLVVLPACSGLLPPAREIVAAAAGAADALLAYHRTQRIVLRVLASSAAGRTLLSRALPAFTARYARVHVDWRDAAGDELAPAIAAAEVDLVAGMRPAAIPAGWRFRDLLTDRFAAVCSPGHPLAAQGQASWKELARQAWLLPPAGSPARVRFDAWLPLSKSAPTTFCVVSDMDEMTDWLLRDRDVLAFVPVSQVHHLLLKGELVQVRAEHAAEASLGLLEPRSSTEPALRLAGFLENFAASCPEAARP